jgi:DNA-binding FadR family transcriptional regulator
VTTARRRTSPLFPRRRLGERLADELRARILRGELTGETGLPKQEELFDEFGVSMPSVREALRTLETEGLITIRRGNRGGATVHPPHPDRAGYMLGLVLQSRGVPLYDLGLAIRQLDPVCAQLCAGRADRAETVVPALQAVHDRAVDQVGNFTEFVSAMRNFHEMLLSSCGNRTLELFIGTLESLWYAHEEDWAARTAAGGGERPSPEATQQSLDEHAELIAAIAKGDVELAGMLAHRHQEYTQPLARFGGEDAAAVVDAQLVRPLQPHRAEDSEA